MEKNTHIRFLVSHAEAGVLFKKVGSTIYDFQTQSGAQIHVSSTRELFPGTADRIVTVSGAVNETLEAVYLILSILVEEFGSEDGEDEESTLSLKMIVPSSSCDGLIGKDGANIRSFKNMSEADIVVSPQDKTYHGTPDYRLAIIDGIIDEQTVAIELILSKLADDPRYASSLSASFPYARVPPAIGRGGKVGKKKNKRAKFKCNLCSERFRTLSDRVDHQSDFHANRNTFVCPKSNCRLRYPTCVERDNCKSTPGH